MGPQLIWYLRGNWFDGMLIWGFLGITVLGIFFKRSLKICFIFPVINSIWNVITFWYSWFIRNSTKNKNSIYLDIEYYLIMAPKSYEPILKKILKLEVKALVDKDISNITIVKNLHNLSSEWALFWVLRLFWYRLFLSLANLRKCRVTDACSEAKFGIRFDYALPFYGRLDRVDIPVLRLRLWRNSCIDAKAKPRPFALGQLNDTLPHEKGAWWVGKVGGGWKCKWPDMCLLPLWSSFFCFTRRTRVGNWNRKATLAQTPTSPLNSHIKNMAGTRTG